MKIWFYFSMKRLLSFAKLITMVTLTVLYLPVNASAGTIRLGGTGSALGTMLILAEKFKQSDLQFTTTVVPNLGSSGGLKALATGVIDIALISRPLKDEEKALGLVAIEYGKTPFILATNKKGITGLIIKEAVEIYAGKQANWPDGSPIRLVLRPASDTDTSLLAGFSPEMKQAVESALSREGMVVALTDQDAVNQIEKLSGALGTTSLAIILSEKKTITPLAIDGVTPSVKTLADKIYPLY